MVVTLVILIGALVIPIVQAGVMLWRLRRRRHASQPLRTGPTRCRCGYELDQLDTIRCPECGRVCGFDATADDLELTDDQLHRAKDKRDARRRAGADGA